MCVIYCDKERGGYNMEKLWIRLLLGVCLLLHNVGGSNMLSGPQDLLNIANEKVGGGSDKISVKHAYQQMYGMFLLPYCEIKQSKGEPIKMLEIGLGCKRADHNPLYSLMPRPQAQEGLFNGYKIWKSILNAPGDELWYAEHDKKCLQMRRAGMFNKNSLQGLHILEGDQSNPHTLREWIKISDGNFDIIIDDGSHKNMDIYTSFMHLWPHIKPGGLYFIEDLQISRDPRYENSNGQFIMVEVIKDWIEQLVIPPPSIRKYLRLQDSHENGERVWKNKIPSNISWIMCQMEACVISKCSNNGAVRCSD